MLFKFKEYYNSKSKNRIVYFMENFFVLNSIKGNILYNSDRISKLNWNNLGDAGIEILINLNSTYNGITYLGGDIVFSKSTIFILIF